MNDTKSSYKRMLSWREDFSALGSFRVPDMFDAAGDGITNDRAAVLAAHNAGGGYILLPMGKTYRISANLAVGVIIANGGMLSIDSGVTLTYDAVSGAPNISVFTGGGIARPSSYRYSLGHYDGATGTEKWNRMRRAFVANSKKTILIPAPLPSDPAYIADAYGSPSYKVTSPLLFNDPENNSTIWQECSLVATEDGLKALIEISTSQKCEDVYWNGLVIDGQDKAIDGIRAHGGARFHWYGRSRITSVKQDGINWLNDLFPADEPLIQFLEAVRYGRHATSFEGKINKEISGLQLDYVFSNGARGIYCTAAVSGGRVTSLTLDAKLPDGVQSQRLTGYLPTLVYGINSVSGNGIGGTATAALDGSGNLVRFIITAGGAGFVDGETVVVTAALSHVHIAGIHRGTTVNRVHVVQSDEANSSGLVEAYDALVTVESTADGAPAQIVIEDVYSLNGKRTTLSARAGSGGSRNKIGKLTASKLHIPNMVQNVNPSSPTRYPIEVDNCSDLIVGPLGDSFPSAIAVSASNVDRAIFTGIPREHVLGNGRFMFDGVLSYYTTGLPTDTTASGVDSKPFSNLVALHTVTLISNKAYVYYSGYLVEGVGLIDINKGLLVDTATSTTAPSDTFGIPGTVTIILVNGSIFINNRTWISLSYKLNISP